MTRLHLSRNSKPVSKPYEELLYQCSGLSVKEDDVNLLPGELQLQAHWFAGHFGNEFLSTEGKKIVIKQFGFWNKSAGPDFIHCCIEIDGKTIKGDIELDHSTAHWELHGHHQSPRFENVILHVCFSTDTPKRFTRTQSNKFIPQLCITSEQLNQISTEKVNSLSTAIPGRCSLPLEQASAEKINQLLTLAAKHRINRKAKLSNKLIESHGPKQALWTQLAETLGYKNNTLNFHVLAQRIPIKELKQYSEFEIQAILFGASNFLHPDLHKKAPQDSQAWLESLWDFWWSVRQKFEFSPERSIKWNLAGIRPVNHPQRRLAALAKIAAQWSRIEGLTHIKEIKKTLIDLTDPFWNHHYTLSSKYSAKALRLIGESRVDDFFLNHLLPNRINNKTSGSWETYTSFRPPAVSEKVNRAAERLFGKRDDKSSFLKKSWQHQALLQIYQDFCLEHISGCEECPFPERLKQWAEKDELA